MAKNLVKLVTAFQIKCRGVDKDGTECFGETRAPEVIVKVYEDGHTEPLCRCLTKGAVVPRCNPNNINYSTEDCLSACQYHSKK